MLRTPAPLIGALGVRRRSLRFVIPIASVRANGLAPYLVKALKAHSNVLRYWFHWGVGCLGGEVLPACSRPKKNWPRALTRYSVVPHPRGLTTSHRLRLKRPGLRATSGSQAKSGRRPSWAEHRDCSETLARLTSPGSKENDDLSEGLEPRTNVREQNGSYQECHPIQATQTYTPVCHLTSQWSGRLRAAHFGAAHRRVIRRRVERERRVACG